MKTLFKQPFPMLVATIVTTATLAACSNEMNPADVSAVEPQAVTVRFTTPSAGQSAAEDLWQENDQVTVTPQAQGDPSITFGYTKQEDGTYVWQNILEGGNSYFVAALPASFTAYYPTTEGTSIDAFTLPTISDDGQIGQADQNDPKKLRAADYMTAPSTTVPYGENTLNLTLAHRLCRLTFVVTEYGNEFNGVVPTLEDVKIKSQNRTVNLTYEGDQVKVGDTTGNPVWVSPLPSTNASNQPTYTTIVTPCTLTSGTTELMSLTVNGISLPVKYKGDLTKLASGSAYTFHLQVGKDYVTVTGSDVTGWTGTETDVTSYDVFTASDLKVGDYYYSDGATSDGGLRKLYSDGTYQMEEGIMPDFLNNSRTVLGIVFYVGDIKGDNYDLLDGKFSGGTHGLVASLNNLNDPDGKNKQRMLWTYGGYDEFVSTWLSRAIWSGGITRPASFTSIKVDDKMQGYANTLALQEYNKAKESQSQDNNLRVKPIYALAKFVESNPPPANSSGWYWPSVCELKCMCWGQGNGQSTAGRDLLNNQLQKVSGTEFDSSSWRYWSSAESSSYSGYAWYVYFYNGRVDYYDKYFNEFSVRPVLAF